MGQFDDLIPAEAPKGTSMFADLIPTSTPPQVGGQFDDLIPPVTSTKTAFDDLIPDASVDKPSLRQKIAGMIASTPEKINQSLGLNEPQSNPVMQFMSNLNRGIVDVGVGFPAQVAASALSVPEEIATASKNPIGYAKDVAVETGRQLVTPFDPREYTAEKLYEDPIGRVVNLGMALGLGTGAVRAGRGLIRKSSVPFEKIPVANEVKEPISPDAAIAPTQPIAVTPKSAPSPKGEFTSRVFERLKEDHPELTGELIYEQKNMKLDAEKAVSLVTADKSKAYRVAMGAEDVALGKDGLPVQTSTGVNIAMAEKALAEGNHSLYSQLVKKRSLDQTRRGQEIVAEKGSVTDNSTARYVKELIKTRMDKVGDNFLSGLDPRDLFSKEKVPKAQKVTKIIDREVAKASKHLQGKSLDFMEAQRLIDSLACK